MILTNAELAILVKLVHRLIYTNQDSRMSGNQNCSATLDPKFQKLFLSLDNLFLSWSHD